MFGHNLTTNWTKGFVELFVLHSTLQQSWNIVFVAGRKGEGASHVWVLSDGSTKCVVCSPATNSAYATSDVDASESSNSSDTGFDESKRHSLPELI